MPLRATPGQYWVMVEAPYRACQGETTPSSCPSLLASSGGLFVLVPRSPSVPCPHTQQGLRGPGRLLPAHCPTLQSQRGLCLIGAAGHSSTLPLVSPKSCTKDSRKLFHQESAGGAQDPGVAAQLLKRSSDGGCLCLHLQGCDSPRPVRARWTKDTTGPGRFLYPHLQMRIFLKTATAARGRREVLFIPTVQTDPFGICVFPPFPVVAGMSSSLLSSKALLPHAASQEMTTTLQIFSWLFFFFPKFPNK